MDDILRELGSYMWWKIRIYSVLTFAFTGDERIWPSFFLWWLLCIRYIRINRRMLTGRLSPTHKQPGENHMVLYVTWQHCSRTHVREGVTLYRTCVSICSCYSVFYLRTVSFCGVHGVRSIKWSRTSFNIKFVLPLSSISPVPLWWLSEVMIN